MNKGKKMTRKRIISGIIAAIFLSLLIWYYIPQNSISQITVIARQDDIDQQAEVHLQLKIMKTILSENKVVGTVIVNGVSYDVNSRRKVSSTFDITDWINIGEIVDKLRGNKYTLSDVYYDHNLNRIKENISIDLDEDYNFISGVIRNDNPTYLLTLQSQNLVD